ncbi:hypothetical protein IWX49DRAFT_585211 [Phyllosticta citricarpa]|uniref:FAD-binding PCMH-type domain-containing protein n=1 Tax=Phyllosticta paracitricarpa TaxID=2016321 RepID=A0ABR1NCP3_9PEZI
MVTLSRLPQTLLLVLAAQLSSASFSCLPGESCWPSNDQWRALNTSLGGQLRITEPMASSCFEGSSNYDAKQCAWVQSRYGDDMARSSVYGAMQNLQWEGCGEQECLVKTGKLQSAPIQEFCSLGALSAYYVNATTTDDVIQTLKFVNKTGVRLSIKNSGHDYLGRSVAANSLALWTRNIRNLEYHENFSLHNCDESHENIGVIGAGVSAGEARDFFQARGMDITLGAVGTVGPAGGFGQGAGHGPFGPSYGLMVDQAVEFDVVTADGVFRTINECNEPDLFWAMRGGGGGTYAVLINYKFKVHPHVQFNTYSFLANITNTPEDIRDSWVYRAVLHAFVQSQPFWSANNISGYNFFCHDKIETHLVYPSNKPLSHLIDLTSEWANFLTSLPGLSIHKHAYEHFNTYKDWATDSDYHWIIQRNAPGGMAVVETGRLVPRSLFEPGESTSALVDALLNGLAAGAKVPGFMLQVYATTPANTPDSEGATSAHPGWRDALWTIDFVSGYWDGTPKAAVAKLWKASRTAIGFIKKLTPGGGCYLNEADYGEEEWQQTFFGANYDKLLSIKRKWDPTSLFRCWKCVGWEGFDDRLDSCYGSKPHATIPLPEVGAEEGAEFRVKGAEGTGFLFQGEL